MEKAVSEATVQCHPTPKPGLHGHVAMSRGVYKLQMCMKYK